MNSNSLILTLLHLKGWGAKKIYSYVSSHSFDYKRCVNGLVEALNEEEKVLFKIELVNSNLTLEKNQDKGIHACNILDKEFPKKLYASTDKCVFIYYKGDINLLSKKAISIIGTRKPDEHFINKGIIATSYFAKKGYVIISGLALGCDSIAHRYCLDVGGKTIAVLPSPCDNVQPSSNRLLADRIVKNGGLLISEYGTGTPISKFNYPQRDRIQSLLSGVILIIQASNESGTMIATRKNIKDGKLVYALKGNDITVVQRYVDVDSTDELEEIENWIF